MPGDLAPHQQRADGVDEHRHRRDGRRHHAEDGELLALLGAGHSNAEIARTRYVVEGTVKAHVSSVLTKLEARNRVQAAILAYEAGLV